jgi:conjugal transfer ATP-binding protein TraC
MRQQPEQIERLSAEKAFSGTKTDLALLKSLKTKKYQPGVSDEAYSEVLVKFGNSSQVCRLYTDRRIQLTLTTKKEEKQRRKNIMKERGVTMSEAIDIMIKEEANSYF